uniref:Guanylate binding protein, putative n=1 Tax=Neospora caninum (strain Liverpool) TaxID=572307 RepID=A0A0F7UI95_NEOCL|nr:TPA: guanylate binding protein, putative [Neospora caninum Liverpool]
MHPPVPAPRPTSRAPVEPFPACVPGNSQRVGSSLYRSPSSQRVAGASPLALSTSGPAPPMSPACFATGDLASTSLSGVEPKAQKPIRSASKNLADPSLRSAQKSVETDAAGGSHTPRRRCTDTRNGTSAKGLAGQSLKGLNAGDHLASDEELNLVATAPTSRTVSNNRTGVGMSNQNGYRTIDPWASYDARQVRDGAKQAAVFPGLHSASSLSQEPQKTWGAKGQPAGPPQPGCRGGGESGPGDAEYPYATKGSNESCSTAASNHDAARTGGATSWGRLELSDGIRYASAYLGKSFSAGTAVPGREAARGDSQALYASAASIGGDVFFRPGAGTASAPTALPVQHHASYILTDPVTHSGSAALHRAPFSQTYQTSAVVRTVDDGSSASPAVATLRDMSRYPATVDHTAAPVSVAYGQPVASSTASRCLPALPMAPLDSCLTADYLDFRPAVQLSPVRNVTSGISPPAVASAVSWHALSSLLASTSAPPICPPASDDSPDVSPAEAKPDAAPAPTTETVSTGAAAPALADKAEDALEKKRKTRRPAPAGLGDSVRVRDFSPSSPSSRAARVHLFCGVVARLMRPAGGAGAGSPSAQVAFQASFATPFHAASLHSGERSGSVGLTSLLLEKTAKPSNRTRLLSRPLQLIHVNRWDGREVLTIDEQAKKFLHELGTQHIAVLSICGVTQTGKSSLANLLLDDSHMRSAGGFPVGSPAVFGDRGATFGSVSPSAFAGDRSFPGLDRAEGLDEDADDFRGEEAGKKFTQRILSDGCTEGVWIQAVSSGAGDGAADGKDDFVYLILDFEGVGCTRKTVEHDQRLFTLAMLVSHYLIYTTRGVLDADAVSGLASVSLWTQRLLQRGDTGPSGHSPASLDDTSRTSLTREGPSPSEGPSVPSGWCAPPLLWILQDFNFTLSDEDDYPLTETDYLEAILATASHPATCCSPFSSSPFSSPSPFSRTCAELNLPHIRMLRQQLETLFGDRTCLALPHPLGDYQDLGAEGVGCDDATSRAFKSAREIDAEPSFGAFMASPGRPSAFSSSFPAITKRESMGRNSEVLSGPRGSARRASFVLREGSPSPGTFSASSPPLPSRNGRDGVCLETVPVSDFQPIYRRRLQQAKNVVFKECRLKAAQSVAITGAGFVKILQRMIDGINGGQVPESGSVVVVVQREECRKWKEKCEQVFMNDLREAFQSRLPMASRELQEGASALQKKALALFKMHVIGDDDVVRGYKQQLKDRLRKITDRAMEENERHGEWKARSRLRALRERLRIDEKLNERLYESMAQVNEDVERLKQEFNADIRGPSHVYQRVMNDQIDELLAKGSEIVCGALLDQSRLAEKTVHELQQRAQEAQVSLEKTLELEQQLQHRDYETEELRRALQEERAAHRGQATFRSGDFDSDDDFCDSYRRRGSYRRSGRSRVSMSDQSKCFRQKCTIM